MAICTMMSAGPSLLHWPIVVVVRPSAILFEVAALVVVILRITFTQRILLMGQFMTSPSSTSWIWFGTTCVIKGVWFLVSFIVVIINVLGLIVLQVLTVIHLVSFAHELFFALLVFFHGRISCAVHTLPVVLLVQHVYRFTKMFDIFMSRLNLIWLETLVFVAVEIESLHRSIVLILLKISLVILKNDLIFHLRIVEILRRKIMLTAIKWPSLMNVTLMSLVSHRNLLRILILVIKLIWWQINVDIVDILLMNHFSLPFRHLLLVLIHSHLLLQLLLLLMKLILLLVVLEILLAHCRILVLYLLMLLPVIILTKILVVSILIILVIFMLMLLWSIINLRCVYI